MPASEVNALKAAVAIDRPTSGNRRGSSDYVRPLRSRKAVSRSCESVRSKRSWDVRGWRRGDPGAARMTYGRERGSPRTFRAT